MKKSILIIAMLIMSVLQVSSKTYTYELNRENFNKFMMFQVWMAYVYTDADAEEVYEDVIQFKDLELHGLDKFYLTEETIIEIVGKNNNGKYIVKFLVPDYLKLDSNDVLIATGQTLITKKEIEETKNKNNIKENLYILKRIMDGKTVFKADGTCMTKTFFDS